MPRRGRESYRDPGLVDDVDELFLTAAQMRHLGRPLFDRQGSRRFRSGAVRDLFNIDAQEMNAWRFQDGSPGTRLDFVEKLILAFSTEPVPLALDPARIALVRAYWGEYREVELERVRKGLAAQRARLEVELARTRKLPARGGLTHANRSRAGRALPRVVPNMVWRDVNHSDPLLHWRPVTDAANLEVLRTIIGRYPGFNADACTFDLLREGTATRNFRVRGQREGYLKLHVGDIALDVLTDRSRLARAVAEARIFPAHYAAALVPIPDDRDAPFTELHGLRYEDPEEDSLAPLAYGAVFPLLSDVEHFSGDNPEQLTSFAECFGRVQSVIAQYPDFEDDRSPGSESYRYSAAELVDGFTVIGSRARSLAARGPNPLAELWAHHESYLLEALNDAVAFLEGAPKSRGQFYHDMHPHNAFFVSNQCVLVYDYHRSGMFPHEEVAAYAAHRFIRERIRTLSERNGIGATLQEIPPLLTAFLAAYSRTAPPLHLDPRHLGGWIRASALRKLNSCLGHIIFNDDAERRPQREILSEARKFIGYLYEADLFDDVLGRP